MTTKWFVSSAEGRFDGAGCERVVPEACSVDGCMRQATTDHASAGGGRGGGGSLALLGVYTQSRDDPMVAPERTGHAETANSIEIAPGFYRSV